MCTASPVQCVQAGRMSEGDALGRRPPPLGPPTAAAVASRARGPHRSVFPFLIFRRHIRVSFQFVLPAGPLAPLCPESLKHLYRRTPLNPDISRRDVGVSIYYLSAAGGGRPRSRSPHFYNGSRRGPSAIYCVGLLSVSA
ncbi:hypothetical protein EVAR_103418_1 [Eumeta japonica]|uniref:Uncharacterized protein n=1 Tax=Eumeta variegata TaxID=151549 RepID=A0A4C1Z948_EUMVA|nr:hypothetical protein EVAR_103418_1 [Eumeta japonica]